MFIEQLLCFISGFTSNIDIYCVFPYHKLRMNNPVLEVKNLTKKFGSFIAVDNLSLHIEEGEILGLLGPNGAGKTTTIQILLGVMEQTSGEIIYFGNQFKTHREEILKQINFSSTYINLPYNFTLEEVLDIFGQLYEVPDRKKRAIKLLKEFELDHLRKKTVRTLSAGENTRLLLVKAFLNYPKIILLDEPTASLDPDIAVKVREFLKKEQKEYNVSMLFTSHNMSEVEEMCDRVIILNHGKVIAHDTPENLAKRISQSTLELVISKDFEKAVAFFKKNEIPHGMQRHRFIFPVYEKRIAEFLMTLAKEQIEYEEISIDKPSLEDYFLQVIGEKKS